VNTIKVIYVLDGITKSLPFEWLVKKLNHKEIELIFVLINSQDSYLSNFLDAHSVSCYHLTYGGKKSYINTAIKILKIFRKEKPNAIHCHIRNANLLGIPMAKIMGIKHRIYTRHYSTYNHQYHPKSVFIDKIVNRLSTKIIAISKVVKDTLVNLEGVKPEKVQSIYHGFEVSEFEQIDKNKIDVMKSKYAIPHNKKVVGCISRMLHLKGHKYIIEAFRKAKTKFPNLHLVLANAIGPYKNEVINYLNEALNAQDYTLIEFENDIATLYQCFDLFIHVPINKDIEAFGQIYVEALMSKIPSIFTKSGVANEFVIHNYNAYVVDYENSEEIYSGILKILTDKTYKNQLVENGFKSIEQFDFNNFITKTADLYV